MKPTIITISRQHGAGGQGIGHQLSEMLNIPVYDKLLFSEAAKRSDIHESFFENAENDSQSKFSSLYNASFGAFYMPLNDRVFVEQASTIADLATQGPCIIIGRGGNSILRDNPYALHVFLYADLHYRINRISQEYNVPLQEAEKLISKMDKNRASYLKKYTGLTIGAAENYHLCLNSGYFGIEETAKLILNAYNKEF